MPDRVISHEDALSIARSWFLDGRDVDMQQLAKELAVGRATLYRVVGSRERLLGDVIESLAQATLSASRAAASAAGASSGTEHVLETARRMNDAIVGYGPLRDFIAREPEVAFRVLFMPTAQVHGRVVRAWHVVLRETVGDESTVDLERLAYMFVRIGESMIYADLLADREPDLELSADLQRHLLASIT